VVPPVVMVLVMVMMVVVSLVMPVVPRRVVGAVTGLRDAGSADDDRPGRAEQCDCACDSPGHPLLLFDWVPDQGGAARVAPSRRHWS
jgi:hypothetical protein